MYNIAIAAMAGRSGNPADFLDYQLEPPPDRHDRDPGQPLAFRTGGRFALCLFRRRSWTAGPPHTTCPLESPNAFFALGPLR